MRRLIVLGAVAVLATGIPSATAVAQPATPAHQAHSDGKFTVVERAVTDTVIDNAPAGDSLGDLIAFGNPVYDAGNTTQIGSSQGSCVRTRAGAAWECAWTTTLAGGSLVVQGPFYDKADSVLAITGGTGIWAGARGEMRLHARDAAGSAYDFTFTVTH